MPGIGCQINKDRDTQTLCEARESKYLTPPTEYSYQK